MNKYLSKQEKILKSLVPQIKSFLNQKHLVYNVELSDDPNLDHLVGITPRVHIQVGSEMVYVAVCKWDAKRTSLAQDQVNIKESGKIDLFHLNKLLDAALVKEPIKRFKI